MNVRRRKAMRIRHRRFTGAIDESAFDVEFVFDLDGINSAPSF
jgi:hypothetical protein